MLFCFVSTTPGLPNEEAVDMYVIMNIVLFLVVHVYQQVSIWSVLRIGN